MQPVLVDRRELAAQALVEIIDNFGIALHGCTPVFKAKAAPKLYLERF